MFPQNRVKPGAISSTEILPPNPPLVGADTDKKDQTSCQAANNLGYGICSTAEGPISDPGSVPRIMVTYGGLIGWYLGPFPVGAYWDRCNDLIGYGRPEITGRTPERIIYVMHTTTKQYMDRKRWRSP